MWSVNYFNDNVFSLYRLHWIVQNPMKTNEVNKKCLASICTENLKLCPLTVEVVSVGIKHHHIVMSEFDCRATDYPCAFVWWYVCIWNYTVICLFELTSRLQRYNEQWTNIFAVKLCSINFLTFLFLIWTLKKSSLSKYPVSIYSSVYFRQYFVSVAHVNIAVHIKQDICATTRLTIHLCW